MTKKTILKCSVKKCKKDVEGNPVETSIGEKYFCEEHANKYYKKQMIYGREPEWAIN